jgi:hypothetical protein
MPLLLNSGLGLEPTAGLLEVVPDAKGLSSILKVLRKGITLL